MRRVYAGRPGGVRRTRVSEFAIELCDESRRLDGQVRAETPNGPSKTGLLLSAIRTPADEHKGRVWRPCRIRGRLGLIWRR